MRSKYCSGFNIEVVIVVWLGRLYALLMDNKHTNTTTKKNLIVSKDRGEMIVHYFAFLIRQKIQLLNEITQLILTQTQSNTMGYGVDPQVIHLRYVHSLCCCIGCSCGLFGAWVLWGFCFEKCIWVKFSKHMVSLLMIHRSHKGARCRR